MKKFISVLCALAMIASSFCFVSSAVSPEVSFRLEAMPVKEGDTTIDVSLIITLPEDATGYELGSFGLFMSYDDSVMQLAEKPSLEHKKGSSAFSSRIDIIPYQLLWVSINPLHQYSAGDNIFVTMQFDLSEPAVTGQEYEIDLAVDEANGVCSMDSGDGVHQQIDYTADQISVTGASITVERGTPVTPEESVVDFTLVAEPVKDGDTTIDVSLIVTLPEDATGYELGSFALDMSYDTSVMQLAEEPTWEHSGSSTNSYVDSIPFLFAWVSVKAQEQYHAGDNVAATMQFDLASPAVAGEEYKIDLFVNEEAGGVFSMPSKDGVHQQITYTAEQVSVTGTSITVERGTPVTPEESVVDFTLVAEPVVEGDTTLNANLYVTLPEDATGYELGSFGLLMSYDNTVMTLAEEPYPEHRGTFQFSQDPSIIPYQILWISINPREQFSPGENLALPVTFNLAEPAVAEREYTIDLAVDRDNGIRSMASKDGEYTDVAYNNSDIYVMGASVIAEYGEPPTPEEAPIDFALVAQPVIEGDTTVTVDLVVTLPEDATGYELGYFGVKMAYDSSVMTLSEEPEWMAKGTYTYSDDLTDNPYYFLWVSVKASEQFGPGDNVAATMVFDLKEPAVLGEEFVIELSADRNNPVGSMASKDGVYGDYTYSYREVAFTNASIVVIEPPIAYGDANEDGSINLADASVMLQFIANWDGVTVNTRASDVTLDGNINLADVSLLLRYIANWDGVILGK